VRHRWTNLCPPIAAEAMSGDDNEIGVLALCQRDDLSGRFTHQDDYVPRGHLACARLRRLLNKIAKFWEQLFSH
jgi:hypothetical protein